MTRRAALAAGLALLLALPGCADDPERTGGPADAAPPVAASAGPDGATPSAGPNRPGHGMPSVPTPKPTPKTKPRPKIGPLKTVRLTGVRAVALTFDDGPHPEWTPKVLDQLRRAKVKATFCVVGVKVRKYRALVARIAREGHTLCNHSWAHDLKLGKKPAAQVRADLLRTNQEIRRAVPRARIGYYRQPGGMWTPTVVRVARELGMTSLHWDVDPADWKKPAASVINKRIDQQVRAGSIVLLHDGGGDRSGTLGACPTVLSSLKRRYGLIRLR
ncbi:polysaccharide deacetylase family protein [Plantactinospora sp. CA-290183]|uniref:polysaccharide deacetylase family protein n=1 Tax=Plantactinospora sp. CA-290183 TaxID=3240006 RepID=UPI003D8AF1D5